MRYVAIEFTECMCDVLAHRVYSGCLHLFYILLCPGSDILRKAGRESFFFFPPHFIDVKSETQRGYVSCLRSHSHGQGRAGSQYFSLLDSGRSWN